MSVLDDWDLVIIARNGSTRVMTTGFVLGARVPATLMSGGIAMLSYMDEASVRQWLDATEFKPFTPLMITNKEKLWEKIRQARVDGYVAIEQQLQTGVRGVAVPMKNRHGEVMAALSVNMPIGKETSEAALARVLQPLQETALSMLNVI